MDAKPDTLARYEAARAALMEALAAAQEAATAGGYLDPSALELAARGYYYARAAHRPLARAKAGT